MTTTNQKTNKEKTNQQQQTHNKMETTNQKTKFKFISTERKQTQKQYNNLIRTTSLTHKQFQTCITKIKQNIKDTQKQTNTTKTEKIKEIEKQITTELEQQLKKYKHKTTTLMNTTAMILHKQYTNQPKENIQQAKIIKEIINKEQTQIEIQYKQIKQQIHNNKHKKTTLMDTTAMIPHK